MTCPVCGRAVTQHPGVTPATLRVYCSSRCKQSAFYARHGGLAAYKQTRRALGATWTRARLGLPEKAA